MKKPFFPEIITSLPPADIPVKGLDSHLVQGVDHQVVFMEFDHDVTIPEHAHDAQWGVVLDGEIELVIGERVSVLKKGDTYFIPANVTHRAAIKAGYRDLSLFNQKDRYRIRGVQKK